MIDIQLKELVDITMRVSEDIEATRERLKRWKSRTVNLLSATINPDEGGNLQNISRMFSHYSLAEDILYDSDQYRAFLLSLKEELEKHPEEVLSIPVAKSEGAVTKIEVGAKPSVASNNKKVLSNVLGRSNYLIDLVI